MAAVRQGTNRVELQHSAVSRAAPYQAGLTRSISPQKVRKHGGCWAVMAMQVRRLVPVLTDPLRVSDLH